VTGLDHAEAGVATGDASDHTEGLEGGAGDSTRGAAQLLEERAAGLLLEREVRTLLGLIEAPKRPLVALLGETYPRQLARLSNAPLASVQRMVNDLEREGVVVSRIVGANREVRINPRFYGVDELRSLLLKYAKRDPSLERRVSELRRRPRRAGKTL